MAEYEDLNTTDASNTARFPERQAASTVNNGARALEGLIARHRDDINGTLTAGGTTDVLTLASNKTLTAYAEGQVFIFEAASTNTASPTLNVDSLGAKTIVWPDGSGLVGGDILANSRISVVYDGTNFQLLNISRPIYLLQTEQATTSGSTAEFTGLPTWIKEMVLTFAGVSTNGTNELLVQVGDTTSGYITTGYSGVGSRIEAAAVVTNGETTGFRVNTDNASSNLTGSVRITVEDSANGVWVASGSLASSDTNDAFVVAGSITVTGQPDRVRINTVNTFDAGAINLLIKG
jgi:hypothetical protein